jgi:hypothetical protein
MTPDEFIRKWQGVTLTERGVVPRAFHRPVPPAGRTNPDRGRSAGCLVRLREGRAPRLAVATVGPMSGGVAASPGSTRAPARTWTAAFRQLQLYTPALEYPAAPDRLRYPDVIRIHTAFTGLVPVERHDLALEDLRDPAKLNLLKWAFSDPERLRPTATRRNSPNKPRRSWAPWPRPGAGAVMTLRGSPTSAQQVLFCLCSPRTSTSCPTSSSPG